MSANTKLILTNARIIDGLGAVIANGRIAIENDRITAVGTDLPPAEPDAQVVDLQGKSVIPGLIDTHIHMVGGDYFPGYESQPVGVAVLRSAEAMRRTLHAGITTVRTAGSRDFLDVDIREAITAGIIDGPRILASGRGITITGGHFAETCIEADGIDEVRKAVRTHVKRGADSLKLMLSAGVATDGLDIMSAQFDQDEVNTAVFEAHKANKRVLTHAISLDSIRIAITAGVDSVDHGYFMDQECADTMREREITLVPTFCPGYYYTEMRQAEKWRIERAERIADQHAKMFSLALASGVSIAMGSDCGAPSRMPNGRNALELELMVRHGMTPAEAIKSSTSHAANLVGLPDLGAITVGNIADLVILDADPINDITVIQHGLRAVIQSGQFVRNDLDNFS